MAASGLARFYGSVFRRRVDAAALVRDSVGAVLAVRSGDGPWALPGAVVKAGEDPRTAAARALLPVLGDRIPAGRMLVFDCAVDSAQDAGGLAFVYDGGSVPAATSGFRAAGDTVHARFLSIDACTRLLEPAEVARLAAALTALETQSVAELVDGRLIPGALPARPGIPAMMPQLPEVSHLLG